MSSNFKDIDDVYWHMVSYVHIMLCVFYIYILFVKSIGNLCRDVCVCTHVSRENHG